MPQVADVRRRGSDSDGAAAATATAAAATTAATSASSPSGASSTTSAAIGTIQIDVNGPGPSLSISEAWINAIAGSPYFANPAPGDHDGEPGYLHLVPLRHLDHPKCQPQQECEPEMNTVREYRMPLLIGAGALVVALILYADPRRAPELEALEPAEPGDAAPDTGDRAAGQAQPR